MSKTIKHVPEPVLRRLPVYCNYLRHLATSTGEFISCTIIGQALNLNPTQIRKDLAMAGAQGRPKVGYDVGELIECLESFMGWGTSQDVFLAGAGNLGAALLGYKSLDNYGIRIISAFDNNPAFIGREINGVEVLSIGKFNSLARRLDIKLAILTVPEVAAQRVCDLMVSSGIQAIWNFAPVKLNVPDNVIVQNEELFASLGALSSKLNALLHPAFPGNRRRAPLT